MADLDKLANEIRRVDGSNRLGAGALAEALWPFVQALVRRDGVSEPVAWLDVADAPQDGTPILLNHSRHGIIQGWFSKGEWSDDTPISPREYSGDLWILGDDLYQDDVEYGEGGRVIPSGVLGWLPLSSFHPAPTAPGDGPLWMMHVRGPDDIYPAPDYETALAWCDYVNTKLAPVAPDVLASAVPALWTGTADAHAEGLPEAIKGWTVPVAALRQPDTAAAEDACMAGGERADVRDIPFNACCYRDQCASDRAQIARLTEQVRVARAGLERAAYPGPDELLSPCFIARETIVQMERIDGKDEDYTQTPKAPNSKTGQRQVSAQSKVGADGISSLKETTIPHGW
jgi:hypothetical protein